MRDRRPSELKDLEPVEYRNEDDYRREHDKH
jgi:hypothetical protein